MQKQISQGEADVVPQDALHPGRYVRETCLDPRGLSVLAAAKLVGVGRPAFSNFLNGNAAATAEMAARIEVAFGVPQAELLAMQSAFDVAMAKAKGSPADATPYAAPFLGILARDFEAWANRNIGARARLAVLLRTLVGSTGREITKVDFPGNDDSERPGWDGVIEARQGTPWIPEGVSGWEFGTTADPKQKAEADFSKSVKAIARFERELTTFVFVTPRHWPGKHEWVSAKKATNHWRDVRAYDSSDLEQWIELSPTAQVWFAQEKGIPTKGVRTLDQCWSDWSNVADPAIPPGLFSTAVEGAKKDLSSRLSQPPQGPIVVMADSTSEALAFLAQFFEVVDDPSIRALRDRVLVFDHPGVAKELAKSTTGFIAVAHSREVERELAPLMQTLKCIVLFPRNATNVEAHVVLEPLNFDAFRAPLEAAGFSRDEVTRLENESGRSLTVLRRRLAEAPSVRTPHWASAPETANSLVPFLWIGAWSAIKSADQTVLVLLSDESNYEALEKRCQQLVQLEDAPLWSVGHYRGVNSKIDLLFAIASAVTREELERFFIVAKLVLGEDDPALDLPEDQRWAASIHGKTREFSGTLRSGIAETLVLLSVHGHHLFWERVGYDCELAAQGLVRDLLSPFKTRLLEANDSDLAAYAEAAPDEFLRIIEEDLKAANPETYGLLRPAGTGMFGSGCPRTGLLWALEGLAWSPATMPRVARILAQLSQLEITDNWMNRPINSLEAIFRSWMPQTAASPEDRVKVLGQLAEKFPHVAWKVCLEQLSTRSRTGGYSHKPKWRNDGQGYGEPLPTWAPIHAFVREVVEMVLGWKHGFTQDMICDLVNCLHGFSPEHRDKVWTIIKDWAANASDTDKATVREHIRRRLLSRRGKRDAQQVGYVALTAGAKKARAALEPSDLLQKHRWLFREHWVEESADELEGDINDYQKRDERITALREEALQEVFANRGYPGLIELSNLGNASFVVGHVLASRVLDQEQAADLVVAALTTVTDVPEDVRRRLVSGVVTGRSASDQQPLLDKLRSKLSEPDLVRVLLSAPFGREIWSNVDALSDEAKSTYWRDVMPGWIRDDDAETAEAIERLLMVSRPGAAFHTAQFNLKRVDPELLFRLMSSIATSNEEREGQFRPSAHNIEDAFEHISASTSLTLEQKAGLEYTYLNVLAKPGVRGGRYGIPNLERYIHAHPELYIQAIVYTYKRNDGGSDPDDYLVPEAQASLFAERGYRLLDGIEVVPGRDEHGEIDAGKLSLWIKSVRDASAGLGRLTVADIKIGELLAHSPNGSDGVWPCEAVRDVLEEFHSTDIMRGAHTGLFNSRGVHWRGEGGAQERALADKYRAWAEALQYSHPFVSSELLMGMVRTYEHDARREDLEASINRKLR